MVGYSEVRAFLKKQQDIIAQYKSITTVNKTITLSRDHLIYARKSFVGQLSPM